MNRFLLNYLSCCIRLKSSYVLDYSPQFDKVFLVCSMKLKTVISLTFCCWPPFSLFFFFFFFDSDFILFLYISVLGSSCCYLDSVSNVISSLSSLVSCWYLSSFAMSVFEFFLDGMFSCLHIRVVALKERNSLYMFLMVL